MGRRGRISVLPDLENLLLSVSVQDEFIRKFHHGSLVWAKVTGHSVPAWPARVTKVMGLDLHYRVTFYVTMEWAVLQEEELWPYSVNTDQKFSMTKFVGVSRKKKMFDEAVISIRQEQDRSGLILPRIETVIKRSSLSSPVTFAVLDPAGLSWDINSNQRQAANRNLSKFSNK